MYKFILLILLATSLAWPGWNQEIPKDIQEIVDNYVKDSTISFGFKDAKTLLHLDESLRSTDISVGIPFQEYIFIVDSLDKAKNDVSVESVIKPTCSWKLPILANGKYVYYVDLNACNGHPVYAGMGTCGDKWKQIQEAWAESGVIKPVLIKYGNNKFIHFPSKGEFNLFYLNPHFKKNSYESIITSDFSGVEGSQKIFKFLKEERVKKRKMQEKSENSCLQSNNEDVKGDNRK